MRMKLKRKGVGPFVFSFLILIGFSAIGVLLVNHLYDFPRESGLFLPFHGFYFLACLVAVVISAMCSFLCRKSEYFRLSILILTLQILLIPAWIFALGYAVVIMGHKMK